MPVQAITSMLPHYFKLRSRLINQCAHFKMELDQHVLKDNGQYCFSDGSTLLSFDHRRKGYNLTKAQIETYCLSSEGIIANGYLDGITYRCLRDLLQKKKTLSYANTVTPSEKNAIETHRTEIGDVLLEMDTLVSEMEQNLPGNRLLLNALIINKLIERNTPISDTKDLREALNDIKLTEAHKLTETQELVRKHRKQALSWMAAAVILIAVTLLISFLSPVTALGGCLAVFLGCASLYSIKGAISNALKPDSSNAVDALDAQKMLAAVEKVTLELNSAEPAQKPEDSKNPMSPLQPQLDRNSVADNPLSITQVPFYPTKQEGRPATSQTVSQKSNF